MPAHASLDHAWATAGLPAHLLPSRNHSSSTLAELLPPGSSAAAAAVRPTDPVHRRRMPPRPQASEPNLSHLIHPRRHQHLLQQRLQAIIPAGWAPPQGGALLHGGEGTARSSAHSNIASPAGVCMAL